MNIGPMQNVLFLFWIKFQCKIQAYRGCANLDPPLFLIVGYGCIFYLADNKKYCGFWTNSMHTSEVTVIVQRI